MAEAIEFFAPKSLNGSVFTKEVYDACLDFGPVDPRKAAEPVSCTYLFSVLKGLHRSPAIRAAGENPGAAGRFGAEKIHCLVIPDGWIETQCKGESAEEGVNRPNPERIGQ